MELHRSTHCALRRAGAAVAVSTYDARSHEIDFRVQTPTGRVKGGPRPSRQGDRGHDRGASKLFWGRAGLGYRHHRDGLIKGQ
jgi:hypothetical protein